MKEHEESAKENQEKKYRAVVDSKLTVKNLRDSEELKRKMRKKLKKELAKDESFLYEAQLNLFQVKKEIK